MNEGKEAIGFPLIFRRENEHFRGNLALQAIDEITDADEKFLTSYQDRDIYGRLRNDDKKREFLAGRKAFSLLAEENGFRENIELVRGVFGHPVLRGDTRIVPEVSLSHSGGVAAVLLFPAGHQMALDLERMIKDRDSRLKAIWSVLSDKEQIRIGEVSARTGESLYTLWSQKEALSKVLKCGLSVPFPLLETDIREEFENGQEVFFTHFHQYKGLSFTFMDQFVLTFVLPKKTVLANREDLVCFLTEQFKLFK